MTPPEKFLQFTKCVTEVNVTEKNTNFVNFNQLLCACPPESWLKYTITVQFLFTFPEIISEVKLKVAIAISKTIVEAGGWGGECSWCVSMKGNITKPLLMKKALTSTM